MEIRTLKFFTEMAKEGSISRAAEKLHISQPAMSKQLKALEREIGKKLFERTNYSIRLTEAGEFLRQRAEDILDLEKKTSDELQHLDAIPGDIYIGCAESEGIKYFAKAVKELQNKYPQICCHLHSGNHEDVSYRLKRGLLDFAIITGINDIPQGMGCIDLPFQDRWGLIMREDSPLAAKTELAVKDLLKIPLICSAQWIEHGLKKMFGKNADKVNIVATYNLAYNAAVMVKENIGYAFSYDKLVYTGQGSGLCFRPVKNTPSPKLRFVWIKGQPHSKAAELLIEEMEKVCGTAQ